MYGQRLRSLRKERRWTIEHVAQMIGKGKSTYAGYETETRQPPIEQITKLAEIYDVSTDYILGLTDDREPKKIESNLKEYLKKANIHWDGKPLSDEEIKPIKDLLEIVVRERLPLKNNNDDNKN